MLDGWRLAVGTLTAIAVRPPTTTDPQRASAAMVLAPVAVLPIGLAATCVSLFGHRLQLPVPVTVFVWTLSAVAPAVTGAWAGLEWWRGALAAILVALT